MRTRAVSHNFAEGGICGRLLTFQLFLDCLRDFPSPVNSVSNTLERENVTLFTYWAWHLAMEKNRHQLASPKWQKSEMTKSGVCCISLGFSGLCEEGRLLASHPHLLPPSFVPLQLVTETHGALARVCTARLNFLRNSVVGNEHGWEDPHESSWRFVSKLALHIY